VEEMNKKEKDEEQKLVHLKNISKNIEANLIEESTINKGIE
jgi:hypothetical protein